MSEESQKSKELLELEELEEELEDNKDGQVYRVIRAIEYASRKSGIIVKIIPIDNDSWLDTCEQEYIID